MLQAGADAFQLDRLSVSVFNRATIINKDGQDEQEAKWKDEY